MAIFGCWKNGYIMINGVDLSDHAREFTLQKTVAALPNDAHGGNTAYVIGGLVEWTVDCTFLQDFAAAKVHQTLNPLSDAGQVAFPVIVGPDATATVSSTNPRYSGNAVMTAYRPFGGAHGVNMEATATFQCGSDLTTRTS